MQDLKTQLAYYAAGEEVPVTIQRQNGSEYEEQKVTITLGKLSDYQDSSRRQTDRRSEKYNIPSLS